jgi:hypothetical protein
MIRNGQDEFLTICQIGARNRKGRLAQAFCHLTVHDEASGAVQADLTPGDPAAARIKPQGVFLRVDSPFSAAAHGVGE